MEVPDRTALISVGGEVHRLFRAQSHEADQCSFQSYSSGVLTASRGVMMPQLAAIEMFQWRPLVRRGRRG